MKHFKLTATFFMVILLGLTTTAQRNSRWLSYEPAIVELEGRVTVQWKYGPPNYGENPQTDKKVKVPVLVLSAPVNVRGTPEDAHNAMSVREVHRVQLVFSNGETSYKGFVGKFVRVKGTLFHAVTGHHYTDVVMDVGSIETRQKRSP